MPIALRDYSSAPGLPQGRGINLDSGMRIELPNGVVIHAAGDLDGQRRSDVIIAVGQIHSVHADVASRGLSQDEVLPC